MQDDGSHSVACEKCNVWQHSRCLGIAQSEAERDDFHFICNDCKRREAEPKLPKLPPLKFKIGSSSSPPSDVVPHESKMHQTLDSKLNASRGSESEKSQASVSLPSFAQPLGNGTVKNGAVLKPNEPHHNLSMSGVYNDFGAPPSPERRQQLSDKSGRHLSLSSPSRGPLSPPKPINGFAPSVLDQSVKMNPAKIPQPPFQQHGQTAPGLGREVFGNGSAYSQRPSSSQSAQSFNWQSPIQNRPSMSPTQGNPDVGFLAGFTSTAPASNGVPAWPPYPRQTPQTQHVNDFTNSLQHSPYSPFHSAAPKNGVSSSQPRSSPPVGSSTHGMHLSGISPTKNSPRPLTSGSIFGGAPVLPPIQRLEPSPKLMGRASSDAPIPPPVKCMTPEQEERRQRENASVLQQLQAQSCSPQKRSNSTGQQPPLKPSQSFNHLPPLESSTGSSSSR